MLNIETVDQAKSFAQNLRTQMKNRLLPRLSVSASLEVLAGLMGYPNWDTLSGVLKQGALDEPQLVVPQLEAGKHFTFFVPAHSCSDSGAGPSYAKLLVDQAFFARLAKAVSNARRANAQLRVDESVDFWQGEDDLRLINDAMLVCDDGEFWFEAFVKHADYKVNTEILARDIVLKDMADALRRGQDFAVYASGEAMPDFLETLLEAGELEEIDPEAEHVEVTSLRLAPAQQ